MPSYRTRSRSPEDSYNEVRRDRVKQKQRSRSPGSRRPRVFSDDEDDRQGDRRERRDDSSSHRRHDRDDRKDGDRRDKRRRSRSRSRERSSRREDSPRREGSSRQGSSKPAGRSNAPLPSQSSMLADAGVPSGNNSSRYGGKGKSRSPSPSAEAIAASKPNFANSGALAAETNTFQGVVLKYNEPPEARKPNKIWRFYVFKGKEQSDMLLVNRQSAYLFGRDRVVADIPLDHPSSSKQHAVLQYRSIHERNEFGDTKQITKPYIIDLESANGTFVNDEKIPKSRYYELQSGDVVKFAFSTKEYVFLMEQ